MPGDEARSPLLDPEFVRELDALRRRLAVLARSGGAGEHTARRRGGAAGVQEHRGYAPGDDLRRVDWLAFARTGEPVVKLFRAEEDVVVRLLLDASASLGFGDPVKLDVARRLAAAIGYVALAGSQRTALVVARTTGSSALARLGRPHRGRAGVPALLRELTEAEATGATDLGRAITELVQRSHRPGMLVVLSDFLDPGPVTTGLNLARSAGHDVLLVQIVDRTELEPTFEGDYALVDAESGATVEVTMDPTAIEAYTLRFAGLVEELRAWARRHGAAYVRVTTDEPLEGAVRRVVARSVD